MNDERIYQLAKEAAAFGAIREEPLDAGALRVAPEAEKRAGELRDPKEVSGDDPDQFLIATGEGSDHVVAGQVSRFSRLGRGEREKSGEGKVADSGHGPLLSGSSIMDASFSLSTAAMAEASAALEGAVPRWLWRAS